MITLHVCDMTSNKRPLDLNVPEVQLPPTKRARVHQPLTQDIIRNDKAIVTYCQAFTPRSVADEQLARLLAETPWTEEAVFVFGKRSVAPRRVCFYGDAGVTYRYAGMRKPAAPWTPLMAEIRDAVSEQLGGRQFNYALLNLYRDGKDSIGFHSDDETNLQPRSTIASVSLGAERDFVLKAKTKAGRAPTTLVLAHGSLLTMEGNTQKHYKHAVPPRKHVVDPRINITFRQIRL